MKTLAFDLGASGAKVILGNFDGDKLAVETIDRFANHPVIIRGEIFWNFLELFSRFKTSLQKSVGSIKNIQSIAIDSFSNDFGLLDKEGRFISQIHTYRDDRTKRNAEKIYKKISPERLHKITGNQNALFTTYMQIASMCFEKQKFLLDESGKLLFLPDLFTYFLTGEIGAEFTIASVSQLMDISTRDWSEELISTLNLPKNLFPNIISPGEKIGKITELKNTFLNYRPEVISVCEHDTASAFLAAPHGSASIIISSGTWSLVGIETHNPIINNESFVNNIANEGGYPGHHRILKNVMGLWIIQELQNSYAKSGKSYSISELIGLAIQAEPFPFMINPNLSSFFSPGQMIEKIFQFCDETNQGRPETVGELIRGVFESLALHYRLVIEEIESLTHKKYKKINIVGGGCQNQLLNQLTASATNRLVIAGPKEATALGNLMVQLLSHGELENIQEGRRVIENSFNLLEYFPMEVEIWNEKFGQYKSIISKKELS